MVDPVTAGGLGAAAIGAAQLAKTPLAKEMYQDALKGPLKGVSKVIATTLAKINTAVGIMGDRMVDILKQAEAQVPEERRIEPSIEVVGRVAFEMAFMDEDNPARRMFVNLLARAMDRDRKEEVHPAFIKIIEQISRDEAVLLKETVAFRSGDEEEGGKPSPTMLRTIRISWNSGHVISVHVANRLRERHFPEGGEDITKSFADADQIQFSRNHLVSLGLVHTVDIAGPIAPLDKDTEYQIYALRYTEFGEKFRKACID